MFLIFDLVVIKQIDYHTLVLYIVHVLYKHAEIIIKQEL
jgi:hypothetical protein